MKKKIYEQPGVTVVELDMESLVAQSSVDILPDEEGTEELIREDYGWPKGKDLWADD